MSESDSGSSSSDSVIIEGPGGRQRRATQADFTPVPKFEMDARARRQQLRHMSRFGVADENFEEYLQLIKEQEAYEEAQKSGKAKRLASTPEPEGAHTSPVRQLSKSLSSTAIAPTTSSAKNTPRTPRSGERRASIRSDIQKDSDRHSSPLFVEQSAPDISDSAESPSGNFFPDLNPIRYGSPIEIDPIPDETSEAPPEASEGDPLEDFEESSPEAFKEDSPEALQKEHSSKPFKEDSSAASPSSSQSASVSQERSPSPEIHDISFWRAQGEHIQDKIEEIVAKDAERSLNESNSPEQNMRARKRFKIERVWLLGDAIFNKQRHIQAYEEVISTSTSSTAKSVLFPLIEELRGHVAMHKHFLATGGERDFGRWADMLPTVEEAKAYEPGSQWNDFDYSAP